MHCSSILREFLITQRAMSLRRLHIIYIYAHACLYIRARIRRVCFYDHTGLFSAKICMRLSSSVYWLSVTNDVQMRSPCCSLPVVPRLMADTP